MKKTIPISIPGLFLLVFISTYLASCTHEQNGSLRKYESIDILTIDTDLPVFLVKGSQDQLEILGPANQFTGIVTSWKNGRLTISQSKSIRDTSSLSLLVSLKNPGEIIIETPTQVKTNNFLSADSLVLDICSQAKVSMDIHCNQLLVRQAAKSRLILNGNADNLYLELKNNTSTKALGFKTYWAEVAASNLSFAEIYVVKTLKTRSDGAAQITVFGNPEINNQMDSLSVITHYKY